MLRAVTRVQLYVDEAMHAELVARSKRDHRSVSTTAVMLIEMALGHTVGAGGAEGLAGPEAATLGATEGALGSEPLDVPAPSDVSTAPPVGGDSGRSTLAGGAATPVPAAGPSPFKPDPRPARVGR